MSLSGRTKNILQISMADRVAANELIARIDNENWTTRAMEITAGATGSAAFNKKLVAGDIVTAVAHVAGTVTFAVVTTTGTFPGALTVTAGDLITAYHLLATQPTGLIFADADEAAQPKAYKNADAIDYVPADPSHQKGYSKI